mmetsp:Transcript_47255/g.120543  ORF Transcript_47255/g.120543 Transcript_47255/m.120543 type:complete len:218 (-) Transcript_47255:402-1055(-)
MLRAWLGAGQLPHGRAGQELPQAGLWRAAAHVQQLAQPRVSAGLRRHARQRELHQQHARPPGTGDAARAVRGGAQPRVHHQRPLPQGPGDLVLRRGQPRPGRGARLLRAGEGRHRLEVLRPAGGVWLEGPRRPDHGPVQRVHRRQLRGAEGERARVALPRRGPGLRALAGQGAAGPPGAHAEQRKRRRGGRADAGGGEALGQLQGAGRGGPAQQAHA